jgi:hypothetical protein
MTDRTRKERRAAGQSNAADLAKLDGHPRIRNVGDESHLVLLEISDCLTVLEKHLGRLGAEKSARPYRTALVEQVRQRFDAFEQSAAVAGQLPRTAADTSRDEKVARLLAKAAECESSDKALAEGFRALAEDEQRLRRSRND